jgi:7-keto-8-aminopelargonate synthetase-like enzyme
VPTGTARLRISLSARHSESEIRILGQSIKALPKL